MVLPRRCPFGYSGHPGQEMANVIPVAIAEPDLPHFWAVYHAPIGAGHVAGPVEGSECFLPGGNVPRPFVQQGIDRGVASGVAAHRVIENSLLTDALGSVLIAAERIPD